MNALQSTTDLSRFASINADHAAGDVSASYAFIPTTRALSVLADRGWHPVKAQERAVRKEEYRGFQHHVIRLRQATQPAVAVNETLPEIVLLNSHNRSSAFQIKAGIFRLVCANGLVVADTLYATHAIRHTGFTDAKVLDAIEDVEGSFTRIGSTIASWRELPVTPAEQDAFAASAALLRWEADKAPDPRVLLHVRRSDDAAPTVWHTFNRVQENLLGGMTRRSAYRASGYQRSQAHAIREVKGVTQGVGLNQALWALTEKFAALKGA